MVALWRAAHITYTQKMAEAAQLEGAGVCEVTAARGGLSRY